MRPCPSGKKKRSRLGALMELARIEKADRPWRQEKRAYRCGLCGAWHLTSQGKSWKEALVQAQAGAR